MKLYLARHGHAVSSAEDSSRPLSRDGKREVERMASFLANAHVSVGQVLHSGKIRAMQTGMIYANTFGGGVQVQETPGLSPNDDPAGVADAIGGFSRDTLIAGHNPHLGRLTALLTTGNANTALVDLSTGAMVCLEYHDGWHIRWLLEPSLLG